MRDEVGAATAQTLVTGGLDSLWAATRAAGADPVAAANVIANQLVGAGVDPARVDPAELAKLVAAKDEIPRKTFDAAIATPATRASAPTRSSHRRPSRTRPRWSRSSTRCSPRTQGEAEAYRAGKTGLLGFFVGQVMKATNGQADARVVNELVREKLGG